MVPLLKKLVQMVKVVIPLALGTNGTSVTNQWYHWENPEYMPCNYMYLGAIKGLTGILLSRLVRYESFDRVVLAVPNLLGLSRLATVRNIVV